MHSLRILIGLLLQAIFWQQLVQGGVAADPGEGDVLARAAKRYSPTCSTAFGTVKPTKTVKPKTTTTTITKVKTVHKTVIPTKTVTKPPKTITKVRVIVSKTTTTLSGKTDTYSSTSTVLTTTTTTALLTETSFTTVTTTVTGFPPSTVRTPARAAAPREHDADIEKRDTLVDSDLEARGNLKPNQAGQPTKPCPPPPKKYPTAVLCFVKKTTTVRKTATKTSTRTQTRVLHLPAVTTTSTSTVVTTRTVRGTPASTTLTFSATSVIEATAYETTTVVQTATETVFVPPAPTSVTGRFRVRDSVSGAALGFVSRDKFITGIFPITQDAAKALLVTATFPAGATRVDRARLLTQNASGSLNVLTLLMGVLGDGRGEMSNSDGRNNLYFVTSNGTPQGSTPQLLSHSYTGANSGTRRGESDVWSINFATGELDAEWIQPDGSIFPLRFVASNSVVFALDDPTQFIAYWTNDGPTTLIDIDFEEA